jgi:Icc-related predicted phosphoesterase
MGYGDLAGNSRTGCFDLLSRVQKIKPLYHIFGHIHEDYGITTNGSTHFINGCNCDISYDK